MNITEKFIEGLYARMEIRLSQVNEQARNCLQDYLGVFVGGSRYLREKHPKIVEAFSGSSILDMAMLNGFAAHVLELDDGHRHGMIHLGASIETAILAVAIEEKLSSDSVLCGIVMGYEAAVRCARAIQPGHKVRGYHVSGTCGTIGSAMGIAFACGYNKEQLKSTLACAVTSAAGLLEIQEEASELKPYNIGRAAMDGVMAAKMGRLALPGPDDILGGKRGFLAALTDTPYPEFIYDFSNEGYAIEGIYQKVHAACRHCHPAIDATLAIRNDIHLLPEQVEKIEVHTYKLAVGSHDHIEIKGISSAKLSTPFAVALAIVKGSAGYADYNETNMEDYNIKMLTRRVSVIEDEHLTAQSPAIRGARVTIYLKEGKEYEASCLYPKGEPENPLTQRELEEKFRGLAQYGGLTASECDEVIAELQKEAFDLKKILNICRK
jgi:2-methylcitrate dehydratase PrpD